MDGGKAVYLLNKELDIELWLNVLRKRVRQNVMFKVDPADTRADEEAIRGLEKQLQKLRADPEFREAQGLLRALN